MLETFKLTINIKTMEYTKENFTLLQTTLKNIHNLNVILIEKQNVNASCDSIREVKEWIEEINDFELMKPEIKKMSKAHEMYEAIKQFITSKHDSLEQTYAVEKFAELLKELDQ